MELSSMIATLTLRARSEKSGFHLAADASPLWDELICKAILWAAAEILEEPEREFLKDLAEGDRNPARVAGDLLEQGSFELAVMTCERLHEEASRSGPCTELLIHAANRIKLEAGLPPTAIIP